MLKTIYSLLAAVALVAVVSAADNVWVGDDNQSNGAWSRTGNWTNNTSPNFQTNNRIVFQNNLTSTNMLYDLGGWISSSDIIWASTFNVSRNLTSTGGGIDFATRLENLSSYTQTVSMNLSGGKFGASDIQLNPVNGDLVINGSIYNDNSLGYSIWGNTGRTLTLNSTLGPNATQSGVSFTVQRNTTVEVNSNQLWQGTTTMNGGTLRVGASGLLGDGNYSGAVALNAFNGTNASLVFSNSGSQTMSGGISGSGSITMAGTGTTTLSGSNSYTGSTLITAGTVRVTSTNSLGAGSSTLTFNGSGATLQFGSSYTSGRAMLFSSAGIIDTAGNSSVLNGSFSGNGGLIITNSTGAGTLTLRQAYSSDIIGAGTLTVASGATLQFYDTTISNNIVNNGVLYWNNDGPSKAGTLSGVISGTGRLVTAGTNAGTSSGDYLNLMRSNSYSGGTLIKAGTYIQGRVAGAYGSGTVTVEDGGTFWTAASQTNALIVSGTGEGSVAGAIRFAGTNVVLSGPILLAGNSSIESAFATTNSISGNINLAGYALTVNMNTNTKAGIFSGSITNGRSLEITGGSGGTVILTGTNSYGASVIGAGNVLQIGTNGSTGTLGTGAVTNSGTIVFNRSDLVGLSNLINGSGSLTQAGSGTLQLLANNGYTGTTLVSRGVLMVGNGGTVGSIGTNDVTISSGASLSFNRSDSITIGNAMSGNGSVAMQGAGTATITGSGSYTGSTLISSGTVQVGNGGTTGSLGSGSIVNNGKLDYNRSDAVTVSSSISGSGSLDHSGTGTTTLAAANTYTGTTKVKAGTIALGAGGSLATNSSVQVDSGASLNLAAKNQTLADVKVNGTVSGSGSLTVTGTLSGSGTINPDTVVAGIHSPGNSPGIQTFEGNLTYQPGSTMVWQLIANTTSNSPVVYDQVIVGGDLTFNGATTLQLVFNDVGSLVNWTDSLWSSNQSWTIYQVSGATTGLNNFTIASGALFDAYGNDFATTLAGSSFSITQNGQNVTLTYTVPEPSTYALFGLGALALVIAVRRKRTA